MRVVAANRRKWTVAVGEATGMGFKLQAANQSIRDNLRTVHHNPHQLRAVLRARALALVGNVILLPASLNCS